MTHFSISLRPKTETKRRNFGLSTEFILTEHTRRTSLLTIYRISSNSSRDSNKRRASNTGRGSEPLVLIDVDVDVVDLRAQADASMPASNNNVKLYNISNF